jgi:hypothetical protein
MHAARIADVGLTRIGCDAELRFRPEADDWWPSSWTNASAWSGTARIGDGAST